MKHNDTQHNDTLNDTWHNDIQHNGTQHNDIKHNDTHNDTWHNDIQHNGTQHNDTQHNDTQYNDTQHNDTKHNDALHVNKNAMLSIITMQHHALAYYENSQLTAVKSFITLATALFYFDLKPVFSGTVSPFVVGFYSLSSAMLMMAPNMGFNLMYEQVPC
jgi:hypothetical protein